MTIASTDVVILEPQRLTDHDDGGGRATGNLVEDGQINNLFPDISRIDRTGGDVALRKIFVGVWTANRDTYLGAHAILTEMAADPNVSAVIFDAGSESDERSDAQNRIESYVVKGAAAQFELLGNQYEGQRALVGFQRQEQEEPEVGQVFYLHDPATGDEQYVRITQVDTDIQTFAYSTGSGFVEFERRRLDIGLSAPLDFTFPGGEPTPAGATSPHSEVLTTEVADAARYWGISNVPDGLQIGDLGCTASSIFAPLVPSAQAETAVLDRPAGYPERAVRQASESDYNHDIYFNYVGNNTTFEAFLPHAVVPGTLELDEVLGGALYTDDGTGNLQNVAGTFHADSLQIDYAEGRIYGERKAGTGAGSFRFAATYRPGVAFTGAAVSLATPVELSNRGYIWTQSFADAKPRPGTLQVSYMAQGRWYTIKDNGAGQMTGTGSGSINYATGTASITTEALPDIGSAIMWIYLPDIADEAQAHGGNQAGAGGAITATIDQGAEPGSVTVTYTSGGQTKTLSDSATVGVLAGDGSGTVDYGQGVAVYTLDSPVDVGTDIITDYNHAVNLYTISSGATPDGSGQISGTIAGAPLEPGTVTFQAVVGRIGPNGEEIISLETVQDDGAGGFIGAAGSINYTDGTYSVELFKQYQRTDSEMLMTPQYSGPDFVGWGIDHSAAPVLSRTTSEGFVKTWAQGTGASYTADSHTVTEGSIGSMKLELIPDTTTLNPIMPGSVIFEWAGKTYYDRDGIIYTDHSSITGAGTAVGEIDYNDRTVTLTTWPQTAPLGLNLIAALTAEGSTLVNRLAFRTPGAPLRPGTFQITITDKDGNLIVESAGIDGVIDGDRVQGTVDAETGIVDLEFVTTLSAPVNVYADSGRYNTVILTSLPLDADIIGLDPVRLPSDGRVPIFRAGDYVVVNNTHETDAGTPVADDVVNLARTQQSYVDVVDSSGVKKRLDPAQYTVDKALGTVTFGNPLVLETVGGDALTPPLTVRDRVEHMTIVTEAEITGEIKFLAANAHDMTAGTTTISSAKVWGDVVSRYLNFFTQKIWDSGNPNWSDERIGEDTAGNYNEIDYPIEVANQGAITEKWAIRFTSATAFDVIGETVGNIGSGSTGVDVAITNPNTGTPYFIMRADGFGSGWSTNNVIRFDTEACLAPLWIARTVLAGEGTVTDDQFVIQARGDAD